MKDDITIKMSDISQIQSLEKSSVKMATQNVEVYYGEKRALNGITLDIPINCVTALIGPSGCGKSTFIRCLNRMNDTIDGCRVIGEINLDGQEIYANNVDPVELRARVGMVFQKPNPFPKSIYDNIAYGPRIHSLVKTKSDTDQIVEKSLLRAGLWDEVKDRLQEPGTGLSGGQQQRLCIARAIAVDPEVILMDEPCSALDPIATAKIEELMDELCKNYTIIIVTHSMQQAARVSQRTAFFLLGDLVELGETSEIFTSPSDERDQALMLVRSDEAIISTVETALDFTSKAQESLKDLPDNPTAEILKSTCTILANQVNHFKSSE